MKPRFKDGNGPREKLQNYGIECLTDAELLAILLKSGTKDCDVLNLASQLLEKNNGLAGLLNCSLQQLMSFKGIGLAKACELLSTLEIVRRINYQHLLNQSSLNHPEKVVQWLQSQIGQCEQECFIAIFLDSKNRVKGYQTLFKGQYNSISIDPKIVFSNALKNKAQSIIIAHNHPSQIVAPSLADDATTKDLVEAGKLLEIPVLDHLIVSHQDYYSYKQHGIL